MITSIFFFSIHGRYSVVRKCFENGQVYNIVVWLNRYHTITLFNDPV